MKWEVTWVFANSYEGARVDIVNADDRHAAIREVKTRHVQTDSVSRARLEILKVEKTGEQ